jgi:hypothetical protein
MSAYRLIFTYNQIAEMQQEYFQFAMGTVLPVLQSEGMEVMDAWSTAYGDVPNRLLSFVSQDLDKMEAFLASDAWFQLREELDKYVTDFTYKIVPYREGFQF